LSNQKKLLMLGAIAGDIIGSIYEGDSLKTKEFELFYPQRCFTDDTVLTIAIADSLLTSGNYAEKLKEYCRLYPNAGYPNAGYGVNFYYWAMSDDFQPYYSWGNGSAMRVSPIGFAFNDLDTVLQEAKRSAEVTHNHPEGIKGAQATASAIFLARTGHSKAEIKSYVETTFDYNLNCPIEQLSPALVSCQDSIPQAMIAFLESTDFEDAIRNAIFIGGDTDTLACITGGIAQAFYGGVPQEIAQQTLTFLDQRLRAIADQFSLKYSIS